MNMENSVNYITQVKNCQELKVLEHTRFVFAYLQTQVGDCVNTNARCLQTEILQKEVTQSAECSVKKFSIISSSNKYKQIRNIS